MFPAHADHLVICIQDKDEHFIIEFPMADEAVELVFTHLIPRFARIFSPHPAPFSLFHCLAISSEAGFTPCFLMDRA
jgi:hypothetical protein